MKFTTKDKEHDHNPEANCAATHLSGFWYYFCGYSSFISQTGANGDWWKSERGIDYTGPDSTMMVRSNSDPMNICGNCGVEKGHNTQ